MINKQGNPFITSKSSPAHRNVIRRQGKEQNFKRLGVFSIYASMIFLAFLLYTIFSAGWQAFLMTEVRLDLNIAKQMEEYSIDEENLLEDLKYNKLVKDSLRKDFPEVQRRREVIQLYTIPSRKSYIFVERQLQEDLAENKDIDLENYQVWVPASGDIDMLMKGKITKEQVEEGHKVTKTQLQYVEQLEKLDRIKKSFNTIFLTKGDSRESETAGAYGSIIGSFFVILICMLGALPLGVAAAIYLEEFAPKNRFTSLIEISVNNLAAVPSIVYGLLGLALYIQFIGLGRSSALVGGLTLALLVLPVIIIATRNSLAAVPPSIKDAARGLGASKMQVLFHHTLPLSLPGIMTGSILSIARALGETAPLLMIGMVAFVKDIPQHITDPSTALPVQIYIWSDLPELGFAEKTSGAIIILLLFLVLANALAVYLRKKFEYKW